MKSTSPDSIDAPLAAIDYARRLKAEKDRLDADLQIVLDDVGEVVDGVEEHVVELGGFAAMAAAGIVPPEAARDIRELGDIVDLDTHLDLLLDRFALRPAVGNHVVHLAVVCKDRERHLRAVEKLAQMRETFAIEAAKNSGEDPPPDVASATAAMRDDYEHQLDARRPKRRKKTKHEPREKAHAADEGEAEA